MATNTSINPYGEGGQAASGIAIADNFTTDSASVALSAAKGKKLKEDLDAVTDDVDGMLSRLGGVEIPFDQPKYYTYNNGIVENTVNNTNGKCSTDKLTISDYKHIYFTGGSNIFSGYFCAIFFDSSDNFVGYGLMQPNTTSGEQNNSRGAFSLSLADALRDVPTGATKVVLQTNKIYASSVIAVADTPYNSDVDEYCRQELVGVKGDGVTDDTTALQKLFDSAWGEVHLKPVTYLITGNLDVNATRLRRINGNGATIIYSPSDATKPAINIYGNHTQNASPIGKTVAQIKASGVTVENLRIISSGGLAWQADQTSDNVGTGIGIAVKDTMMPTIRGCHLFLLGTGIKFTGTNRNANVDGNYIHNCWDSGIEFADGCNLHQVNIVGNHIGYCKYGLNFDNPAQIANVQVTGNDIETQIDTPNEVTEADKRCIRMVTDSGTTCLYEIEISGNTLQGHYSGAAGADHVIEVSGKGQTLMSITGNHISNCAGAVISLTNVLDVSIVGNNINNTGGGFVYIDGTSKRISVSGNTMTSNNKYLVSASGTANVTNVSVSGNLGGGINGVSINGESQDYISVVGNCLGGGTVTIGTATHKQEANNI